MKNSTSLKTILIAGAMLLPGCADQPTYQSQQYPSQQYPSQQYPSQAQSSNVGTVERIEVIQKGDSNNIAGTVIGGIVGGLIGSQVGQGRGSTAATIIGAAGGAYAGNQIQKRQRGPNESFRVTVRLDNGAYQTITEDNLSDLHTGDRVRLDGNRIYRY